MPYYIRKRITDIVINLFMLGFLVLTLLPIGWMVFSSLKDSTDIAIGRVGLRRAGTEILEIVPEKDRLLALSANGGISLIQTQDLKLLQSVSYKTSATSYWVDDKSVWIASANRGLTRVPRDNLSEGKTFPFPPWGNIRKMDMNKVTTTFITREADNLFLSMNYRSFAGVWKFDANLLKFIRLMPGAKDKYFPNSDVMNISTFPGIEEEVFSKASHEGYAYLGSSSGKVYKYSLGKRKIEASVKVPHGHLLVRFSNYVDMWKNVNFGLYLRNSLIICGFTMFFAMIFSTLTAYALSRFRFPGSDLFSNAILATQMIPAIMYLIPLYIMFVKFTVLTAIPVKGTFWGIILIYSAFFTPFSIWILRGFFAAIPKELEEAALIDGCSRFKVFWYIALPLAIPGIIATGIYTFLAAWDELMFAWVLTNADTMTIPVGIRLFVGNYQNRFDLMMAAATVATIPVVVIFFMLQKYIVKGLTAGAVKG